MVTSNYHIPKTAYAFRKVFGKEFSFEIVPALTYLSPDELLHRLESEKEKLKTYKEHFENILDGDDRAIQKVLATFPWYA